MMEMVEYICNSVIGITAIICGTVLLLKVTLLLIRNCHEKKILFDERNRKKEWENKMFDRNNQLADKENEIKNLKGQIENLHTEKNDLMKNTVLVHLLLNKLKDNSSNDLKKEMEQLEESYNKIESMINK